MLITTVCPRCQTSYQVQDSLRGKPMRCPQDRCRHIFFVGEQRSPTKPAPAAPSAPPTGQQSGSVGDLVPLLSVEPEQAAGSAVAEPAPPSWRDAPPVRRGAAAQPAEPVEDALPVVEALDDVAEPIRDTPRRAADEADKPRPRGRLVRLFIVAVSLGAVVGLGAGGVVVWMAWQRQEKRLADEADKLYEDGLVKRAAERYARLVKDYPNSDRIDRYKFRRELSEIRGRVADKPDNPSDLIGYIEQFAQENARTALLSEHANDTAGALIGLLVDYGARNVAAPADNHVETLRKGKETAEKVRRAIRLPRGVDPPPWENIDAAIARVEQSLGRERQRTGVLARLTKLAEQPSFQAIREARALLRAEAANFPDLDKVPQVKQLLQQLVAGHQTAVRYVAGPLAGGLPVGGEEQAPSILFAPLLAEHPADKPDADGVSLALVRGVLYWQGRRDGRVRWAVRVGIDTTELPVRVPASAGSDERILVLSSDTRTLTARAADGSVQWHYRLNTPSLGRPIVYDRRAFLATYGGEVHEVELFGGKLLGRYLLGQRLSLGGTHEPGTPKLYFPADDGCVYVLNVRERRCEAILYSEHPSGSLRGEPIIAAGGDGPGYLVLTQVSGLRHVELRVFDLPIRPDSRQRALVPPAVLDGWTWFRPRHDPEKVVLIGDTGVLGLFGIRQSNNQDQALFPLLPGGGLHLPGLLGVEGRSRGRSEVVQVQGDDIWALAAGRLQRYRLAWSQHTGRRVVGVWPEPPSLGSPVHASQAFDDRSGRTFLVSVTRPEQRSVVWSGCVDDEDGELRWRRQLGLVCRNEPMALLAKDGPVLLAVDRSGALFAVDPQRYKKRGATDWLVAPQDAYLAGAVEDNATVPPALLRGDDGRTAWLVAFPGGGRDLLLRRIEATAQDRKLAVSQGRARLPATLAGRPALVAGRLVLPLADGNLMRVPAPLADATEPDAGATWRGQRAQPEAPCWAVPLGGDQFLSTDGSRGLNVWEWPAGGACTGLPTDRKDEATLELPDRIVAAPVRLPGKAVRVCVADSANKLHLLEVQKDGSLLSKGEWDLRGAVTTGPWVVSTPDGDRVACVVERTRLVWVDPQQKGIAWAWSGDDALVGRPQLAEGLVVTADQNGRYVGLHPATGKPVGGGYQLRGSVAPVSSPVAFDEGHLLAPLSDGTTMVLAVEQLRKK